MSGSSLRVSVLTREYPPYIYGGAGVHVDFLVRELASLVDTSVVCMGPDRPGATAHSEDDPRLADSNAALRVLSADLAMTADCASAEVVHSHTWYANMAGHWAKLLYGVPHVITAHSLEPDRPWKAEQLGGGYRVSSWAEKTAYEAADAVIAVSSATRDDILRAYPAVSPSRVHVIHNGIDTSLYFPDPGRATLDKIGVDPDRPYAAFVGRITRQKGVPHLLRAALDFHPDLQLVLLAGAADTPELKAETDAAIAELHAQRTGVFVVSEMLPPEQVREVLSHALFFCCPSVYEPLGIVNLEAMACGTAVVASNVGGIPEVVEDGRTGLLAPYEAADPAAFEAALAAAANRLVEDPALAASLGQAGLERVREHFNWRPIAERTVELYRSLL
ncbi:glycosyl transferase family 1 [Nocardioides phosphati]|uniref:Glycosyl transferase family 1 n=1 Tax=Nocardioides phosphati TaxID=1867775 RepID=A0ABQ2N645_9ACTN|nr:glycosyl transferase family 1 [Nocardioides phosphati]